MRRSILLGCWTLLTLAGAIYAGMQRTYDLLAGAWLEPGDGLDDVQRVEDQPTRAK